MKITTRILVACLPGIVSGALFAATTGDRAVSAKPDAAALSKAKTALAKTPLSFETNRGQTDPRVQFVSRGPGYNVYFTKEETVMTLKDTNTSNAVVRMKFVGGNTSASASPLEALSNTSNYFIGNDSSKWVTGVAQFSKLRYENVYPGIDVLYQGDHSRLRYDFIVKPGASAAAIEMAFDGADNIALTKDGDLALTIHGKTLITKKPFTYQEDGGAKKEVASHYVLKDGHVTFELAKYDTTKNVVIDPTVVFVTFLGGLLNDSVNGVAILNPNQSPSAQPSAYFVAGTTNSLNFPASTTGGTNGLTNTSVGVNDVFVTKISFNGGSILWSTYIGGNSNDAGNAIAIDQVTSGCAAAGCAVVVGQTFSANFPVFPYSTPSLSGTNDAFALKLNAAGSGLTFSNYIGGIVNDNATSVAVNNGSALPQGSTTSNGGTTPVNNCYATPQPTACGDVWVAGYTDSPSFMCPGGVVPPVNSGGNGLTNCINANNGGAGGPTTSSDAFLVRIPSSYPASGIAPTAAFKATLYGGFGEDQARAIAFNPINNMVYIAGDTTTAAQNFVSPNNVNLPGITNFTGNMYTVGGAVSGLPGPGPQARGGFVAAFDAASFIRTFASYVAVSPVNSLGTEIITGIAAEGGAPVANCNLNTAVCTNTSTPPAPTAAAPNPIFPTYGNVGHIYITGDTTSHVTTNAVAAVVNGFGCVSPLIAASTQPGTYIGPSGTQIITPGGGFTVPQNCVTALVTQAPYNQNYAVTTGCPYPAPFHDPSKINATCNMAAFVAVIDGALLPVPSNLLSITPALTGAPYVATSCTGTPAVCTGSPVGNQIEYFAYYSSVQDNGAVTPRYTSGNSSTVSNAIAIDVNPTTLNSTYNLGTYQQMYITGATTLTAGGVASGNQLPVTKGGTLGPTFPDEAFVTYNAAVSGGGGVGGYTLNANVNNLFETDAFVARFNPNGVVASAYGGLVNNQNGLAGTTLDRSPILHVPQFNYGEFIMDQADSALLTENNVIPNTVGNAIAVDPTRAVIIGGATNIMQATCKQNTTNGCNFTTTNSLSYSNTTGTGNSGAANAGGQDGWVSVLFFNDILTDASSIASANPFLQPSFPQNTNGISYIQVTPPPFGPTFDFAISDMTTQTQSFRVLFTGQNAGLLATQTPWYVPLDTRFNPNSTGSKNNGRPGSAVVYYLPCANPSQAVGSAASVTSAGFYNNPFPAPGSAYGPNTCARPNPDFYLPTSTPPIPTLFSGFPGIAQSESAGTAPGWLLVSQDVNPGVVRLALDRRAAAGLLEGVYVAQFLVTTYDSQNASQWPPCGPGNGFSCNNQNTALPADNSSILVTVRLIVRPSLFLSRNAGILTGVTGIFAPGGLAQPGNPFLYGPAPAGGTAASGGNITYSQIPQGTSSVPDWLYVGNDNSVVTAALSGTNGFNSGPAVCQPFVFNAANNTFGNAATLPAGITGAPAVQVPCLATGTTVNLGVNPPVGVPTAPFSLDSAPLVVANLGGGFGVNNTANNPSVISPYGATAYALNGPGDFSGGFPTYSPGLPNLASAPTAATPTMNFFYDVGTVQTPNIEAQLGLAVCRPDLPYAVYSTCIANQIAGTQPNTAISNLSGPFSDNQGGIDPATQHNDVTVHDYYVTVEGGATLNVEAINCTDGAGNPLTNAQLAITPTANATNAGVGNWLGVSINGSTTYTPICTNHTVNNVGVAQGPAFSTTVIKDEPAVAVLGGGQKISLDFKVFAFSLRPSLNGINTGTNYSAQVYVWSTRAKNSVPGYCLGANIQAPSSGCAAGPASSTNPFPLVQVTGEQMFNVRLIVNDTSQAIQITNPCPASGIQAGSDFILTSTVSNSENLATGNPFAPFGTTVTPFFANFGVNGNSNVVWSLVPFGPASGQSTADFLACKVPTGGNAVAGVGSLSQVGPSATTSFIAASSFGTNAGQQVRFYACRPTIAPAVMSTNLTLRNFETNNPDPSLGLFTGPVPTLAFAQCSLSATSGGGGNTLQMLASKVGLVRANVFNFDSNGNGVGPAPNDLADRVDSFAPAGGVLAGDVPVVGDWTGDGHFKAGWFRPTGGQWFLDVNNNGVYDPPGSGCTPTPQNMCDAGPGFSPFTATNTVNSTGILPGAFTNFGGTGDVPVVGDWAGIGRTTIGIRSQGFLWVVDTMGNGVFKSPAPACTPLVAPSVTPTYPDCNGDTVNFTGTAVFAFGGPGDTPVVGNFSGRVSASNFPIAQAAVVRPAGGAACGAPPQSTATCTPFLWIMDSGIAGTTNQVTPQPNAGTWAVSTTYSKDDVVLYNGSLYVSMSNFNLAHVPTAGSPWILVNVPTVNIHTQGNVFAFGGAPGDIPIVGDWYNTGIYSAGVFRGTPNFLWVFDTAVPLAPQSAHGPGTVFAYGGLAGDKPIVGKW